MPRQQSIPRQDRHPLALLLIALLIAAIPLARSQAQSAACGAPTYDPANADTSVYVWQDCPANDWHVRGTSGSGWHRFTGNVTGNENFSGVSGFSLEGADVLDTGDPATIRYEMGISNPFEDGFDFSLPGSAGACFRLDTPTDAEVRVGSGRTVVRGAFDTATLGPCGSSGAMLSVGDVTLQEWQAVARFTVQLSGSSTDTVTVDFRTVPGTAESDTDFVPSSGSLTFPPGTATRTVTVDVVNDDFAEGTETFSLEISGAGNAEIADPRGTATIDISDGAWACGVPTYDAGTDAGVFLWRDCGSGNWRVRVAAGGGFQRFEGTLQAPDAFAPLTPVSLESADELTQTRAGRVDFSFGVAASGQDGFNFGTASNAGTCFGLSMPSGTPVRVGPRQAAIPAPFDLRTLASCQPAGDDQPYNVVVVFTDDQRFDTLPFMPNVRDRLMPEGVDFENAYVPTPLCCPARASVLSGGYLAQNTGVLENVPPNGGSANFDDSVNLGTRLQQAGYRTLFVGKWQNDYPLQVPYVPPGWDTFAGRASWASTADWSSFEYLVGSSGQSASVGNVVDASGQYHVYHERDRILEFLDQAPAAEPFLVFWSTTPPHPPATPAGADQSAYPDYSYRGRGVGESDLTDKPPWVQTFRGDFSFSGDFAIRQQLRSMLSVDRSIGAIIDTLSARGELDETVFIITSDNGYMWGEHGLWGKNFAYEESIRVPLLVVMPGVAGREDAHLVSAVLDLGPTLYDIAGIPPEGDGRSLLPLLANPAASWRNELFFEKYHTTSWPNGLWAGLRRGNWKYVRYWNDDEELYNLATDPYELNNRAGDAGVSDVLEDLSAGVDQQIGLAIKPRFSYPDGRTGENYSYRFETFGGEAPFEWEVESGSLPPGLSLDPDSGVLAGTPQSAGTWSFRVRVTDSAIATQTGELRTFVTGSVEIDVN